MFKWLIHRIFLTCVVLGSFVSCAMDPTVVSVWGGDVTMPKLVSLVTESVTEISANFTAPVSVACAKVVLLDNPDEPISLIWTIGSDPNSVRFVMPNEIGIGINAALSATVSDEKGNTLSFSIPFTGYNTRVPLLRINEIRTEYSKPKVEFIELFVVRSGNLSGVEIFNAMNTVKPSYVFPSVEVAEGDYIVYHLRSVEEGLVDETGAIDASAGIDSRPFARDFWDTLTSAPLKKTNVLLLRDRKGGAVMDAFLGAETEKTDWPLDALRLAAGEVVDAGQWLPGGLVLDAVGSTGSTVTRSIGRNELSADSNRAVDWKICATSKCSPGAPNVPF